MEDEYVSEEEYLRSMAEEGVDREHAQILAAVRSDLADLMRPTTGNDRDYLSAFFDLDYADRAEASAATIAVDLAEDADDFHRGAALFGGREEDRALAETMRGQAAWSDAKRAEAEGAAADARRLRGRCLRTAATAETSDVVILAAVEYIAYVSEGADDGGRLIPSSPEEAARSEAVDAAARDHLGRGARFAEEFVRRAERLTRGAAALGLEGPEEKEVAEALRERAAWVEALCADPEALVGKMMSSGYWRLRRTLRRQRQDSWAQQASTATAPAAK